MEIMFLSISLRDTSTSPEVFDWLNYLYSILHGDDDKVLVAVECPSVTVSQIGVLFSCCSLVDWILPALIDGLLYTQRQSHYCVSRPE